MFRASRARAATAVALLAAGAVTAPATAAPAAPLAAAPAGAASSLRCGVVTGGSPGRFAAVTDVRVGHHARFDRFVVQFRGRVVPGYRLEPQRDTTFHLDPSDRVVRLLGTAGLRLVLSPASGQGTFHGRLDQVARFPELREARRLGDFEHVTSWALGLRRPTCVRVFTLSAPTRLVVDLPIAR
ncbi:MAG: AMIN-like domain-containing (lipo)protein [Jatrophihabitans sp.]|uniref:AMIN-like domain-containing (lipo)protein n=1 Tax=Jatrophihabitans sp. TaxID=1932789 RepID=UPI003F7F3361